MRECDRADGDETRREGGVLGLGVDLCSVRRLEQALSGPQPEVLAALFTAGEIARCSAHGNRAAHFAACFAAKEAVLKALAPCRGRGTFWLDVEILIEAGRSRAVLNGRLGELAAGCGIDRVVVAHGWCRRYATATALALARDRQV